MQAHTADLSFHAVESSGASESLFQRIWPPAFILTGLGLTGAWVSFLGYAFVQLIVSVT